MDEINAFFDFSKEFKRVRAPRGVIGGNPAYLAEKPTSSRIIKKKTIGIEYATDVSVQEERTMRDFDKTMPKQIRRTNESQMEVADPHSDVELDEVETDPKCMLIEEAIYSKYNFNMNHDENLPIHDCKDEILNAIRKNPVVVLQGDTGCGKTTQVPQYILHEAYKNRQYCRIVVTQPRRIAAISIAGRVSAERKWNEGSVVGYQVGLHANISEDTRLLFCTTGVLLHKLITEKSLTQFTHIILDEVHERDADMDFLLIVIRRLLTTNSKNVKIILMSATIDTNEFSRYFKIRNRGAPILRVDKRRLYNVAEFYLDDLDRINTNGANVDMNAPGISREMLQMCVKLVVVIDSIEKREKALNSSAMETQNNASILIFLPGLQQIDDLYKRMEDISQTNDVQIKMDLIRLHSMITPDEQIKVFHRSPKGFRKVILATNIAESSITVPDVKYVIDFCLTKVLVTDTATDFSTLQLQWAAKSNCRQRAGRAGRVSNGRVYRMVPKNIFNHHFNEFADPEMLRCPLETIVLKSKMLEMGSPADILGLAMNPPNLTDIENTILKLKELGALFLYSGKEYNKHDGDLTFIGRLMSALPLDIRLSRLIVLGYVFSCLDEAIVIAAGLSVRSIFNSNFRNLNNNMDACIHKLFWAQGTGSDLLAILKAYTTWIAMCEQRLKNEDSEFHWAKRYCINLRSLKEMHLVVGELRERLAFFGLKEEISLQRVRWIERERAIVLKIVIAGAFYPNYFTRTNLNDIERQRNIYNLLDGNDPCTTIYFSNFNSRHIGPLYGQAIKEMFRNMRIDPRNIEVHFQAGSERVFVTFKGDDVNKLLMNGQIRPEIYKAMYMRMLNMRPSIRVMEPNAAIRYLQKNNIGYFEESVWKPAKKHNIDIETIVLPSLFEKSVRGYISQIETCSKFFFQPLYEMDHLREIHELLSDINDSNRFRNPSAISKGMILAAPFEEHYHRATVLNVISSARSQLQFKILYIDFGNTASIDFDSLRAIPSRYAHLTDLPPRCFECRLAMVHPSNVKSDDGLWHYEAMELLQKTADSGIVEMEIYSIVNGVVNVIISDGIVTFNDKLVELGLARKSDENYMSKYDHDLRLRKQTVTVGILEDGYDIENQEYKRSVLPKEEIIVEPPPPELCTKVLNLRGPYTPLETKMYSAVRVGTWKTVTIDRTSVNCVLLDTDPHDLHERLVVAASITESSTSDILTARDTTIMPNIHGFGALMTMLFCPKMQIKPNKERTKYVSILAGLGYDEETMEPLHEEHDIVLNLDVDILNHDVELINQLRYCMDGMFYTAVESQRFGTMPQHRADLAVKIKSILTRLLNKNRKYVETNFNCSNHVWEKEDSSEIIETPQLFGQRSIFSMHSAINLLDENFEHLHALNEHCKELHSLRLFDDKVQPILCKLCNQRLENVGQIRIHLLSQLHRDREAQIRFKPSN